MKCCFGERNRTDQRKTDRSSIHHEPQKQIRRESKITLTTSKVKVGDVQGEKEREEANEMKKSKLLEKIDVMEYAIFYKVLSWMIPRVFRTPPTSTPSVMSPFFLTACLEWLRAIFCLISEHPHAFPCIITNITAMNTTKSVPDYDHVQNGVTWIGGTTHELQKQHIPGYAGHVKGLFAENVYGKNFARVTAECLNDRHSKGIDINKDEKYRSTYKNQYEQPDQRRNKFITAAETVLGRLDEAQRSINQARQEEFQKQPKSIEEVPPIDRLPIPGYMGHRPIFRAPIREVRPAEEPRPVELAEKKVLETMLQTGEFDKQTFEQITKQEPVVGYGGFLKGVKAENQYGVSYRELAKKSIQS